MMDRRCFVICATLSPLLTIVGCSGQGEWPEGMVAIKWDRDTCVRCGMVISDRRFATELRGGPKQISFKFDDIGCCMFWLREKAVDYPWMGEAATRLWVADSANRGDVLRWHDARKVQYVGKPSPMGYNFAAIATPQQMAVDFATMRQHVLARGK